MKRALLILLLVLIAAVAVWRISIALSNHQAFCHHLERIEQHEAESGEGAGEPRCV